MNVGKKLDKIDEVSREKFEEYKSNLKEKLDEFLGANPKKKFFEKVKNNWGKYNNLLAEKISATKGEISLAQAIEHSESMKQAVEAIDEAAIKHYKKEKGTTPSSDFYCNQRNDMIKLAKIAYEKSEERSQQLKFASQMLFSAAIGTTLAYFMSGSEAHSINQEATNLLMEKASLEKLLSTAKDTQDSFDPTMLDAFTIDKEISKEAIERTSEQLAKTDSLYKETMEKFNKYKASASAFLGNAISFTAGGVASFSAFLYGKNKEEIDFSPVSSMEDLEYKVNH